MVFIQHHRALQSSTFSPAPELHQGPSIADRQRTSAGEKQPPEANLLLLATLDSVLMCLCVCGKS